MPTKRGPHTRYWREVTVPYVLRRDGYVCHLCGGPEADSADHLIPRSQGGSDHPENLAAVHHDVGCRGNRYRGDKRTPEQTRQRLAQLGIVRHVEGFDW